MTEPTVDNSLGRTIEISHGPRYDTLLNLSADRQDLVQELAGKLTDGVPDDWTLLESQEGGFRGYNYIDDPDAPRFFVKSRFLSGTTKIFRRSSQVGSFQRRIYNAGSSIANEIALSPKIKTVLESEEALALASQQGFEKVRFVEPLVGLIDRQTGGRALVYEFVEGDLVSSDPMVSEHERAKKLADGLRGLFGERGIVANDLDTKQFMFAKDGRTAYMLDAEQFFRK